MRSQSVSLKRSCENEPKYRAQSEPVLIESYRFKHESIKQDSTDFWETASTSDDDLEESELLLKAEWHRIQMDECPTNHKGVEIGKACEQMIGQYEQRERNGCLDEYDKEMLIFWREQAKENVNRMKYFNKKYQFHKEQTERYQKLAEENKNEVLN